jgi:glycosyltransferase involved in cell wall biosynthesis
MPLSLREALAVGLPAVASAAGGAVELDGAPGLALVAPGDPGALAEALSRHLTGAA